jgi:tetratricopeptide (TPR) repeat protein
MAAAYMQIQDYSNAEEAFTKVTKLEPGNATAFLGLGAALNQRGDFNGAVKPLLHCLELSPNAAEAHYELGRSFWGQGKWQDAEPHARKALEINKEFSPAHVLMGNVLLRQRNATGALSEFKEYLRLDPQGLFAASVKEIVAKIEKSLAQR